MTTLRNIILGAASLAALAAATSASAQSTATATGTASVTIIAPITLSKVTDMDFGKVVPNGTSAGTVALSAAASTTPTASGVTLLTSSKSAAKFTVGGTVGQTYALTLPASAVNLGFTGLDVDTFTSATAGSGTISATAASNDIYVGATLHVPATVTAGTYSGAFNVSVNYN